MTDESNTDKYLDPLLRVSDVVRRLKISRSLAYQLLQSGEIPTVRIRNKIVRVYESDLEQFIYNSRTVGQV
jgi:excisionase family DNA binding protein